MAKIGAVGKRVAKTARRLLLEARIGYSPAQEELKIMAPKSKSANKKKPAIKNLKVTTSAAKRVKGGAIRYIK